MRENDPKSGLSRRQVPALLSLAAVAVASGQALSQENRMNPFAELLELSRTEKKGLTFYTGGQSIAGIVMKVNGNETVEVRNQTHSRVVIRLDRVDAVAIA
jgi:endonuclease YncB( thermonuclease family)